MDQIIQALHFGQEGDRRVARVLADFRADRDPRGAFFEEVKEKRSALPRGRSRRGDMHRWCGKPKRAKLGGSWVTIYVEE